MGRLLQIAKLSLRRLYSRGAILRLRESLFRKLLYYAWDHSEFYKKYYQQHGIQRRDLSHIPIEALPFTDKKIIMEHLDQVFTQKDLFRKEIEHWLDQNKNPTDFYKGKYVILHTSGSSGTPSIVAYDLPSWNFSSLAFGLRVSEFSLLKQIKAAFVGATHGHFAGVSYSQNSPKLIYDFKVFSILDSLQNIVEALNRFQPEQLFGYSSIIARLAEESLEGRLEIHPKIVGTSGEPITNLMIERIKKAWKVDPRNMYISSETLLIGFSPKPEEDMKIYDDLNYVELLNTDKANEASVTITNLFNYTTPLIRYQMGDLVEKERMPSQATHSSPFSHIYKLVGRSYELFPITTNQGSSDYIHPIVLVEFFIPDLKQIQFISIQRSRIEIHYHSDRNLHQAISTKFHAILKQKEAELGTQLLIKRTERIEPDLNGKVPFIKIV